MNFVHIGVYRINLDRITHFEETPSGEVYIYFGGQNVHGEIVPGVILDEYEAPVFLEFFRNHATLLNKDAK